MPVITFEPLAIDTSSADQDGRLVFADDILEAVIVQLGSKYSGIAKPGDWFLEAGFGACSGSGEIFRSLDEVRAWVVKQVCEDQLLRGRKRTQGQKSSKPLRKIARRALAEQRPLQSRPTKKMSVAVEDRPQKVPPTLGDLLYAKCKDTIQEHDWTSLIHLMAAGDPFALHALYDMTHRFVFTLSLRITRSREAAEELTVDIFHDIWRQASRYDAANGSVLAWIMSQARSQAVNHLRLDPSDAEADIDARDILEPSQSLQERVARRIAEGTGNQTVPPPARHWSEPDWEQVAPGIECKLLATDAERHRVSMLVRLAPGANYPAHTHADSEELHLLAGELWIDGRKLLSGDYNYAARGAADDCVWTETGCTCVLVTSTKDVLRLRQAG